MTDDIEMQARRLNSADADLREFFRVYFREGYDFDEIMERVTEIAEEEAQ